MISNYCFIVIMSLRCTVYEMLLMLKTSQFKTACNDESVYVAQLKQQKGGKPRRSVVIESMRCQVILISLSAPSTSTPFFILSTLLPSLISLMLTILTSFA